MRGRDAVITFSDGPKLRPRQPIDGTITKASAPISIFARSYESHLVDPYKPSPEEDFVLPPNTPENAGAPDENAEHRTV